MGNQSIEQVILSQEAIDFITLLRDNENSGIHSQIEVMEQLLIEFIRDESMGEENNRKYMNYLADVIELTRSLLI
jgi:hypothetical protein